MTKRILVIDDESAIRKSFSLALEDTGYTVDTAESGEKGIEMEMAHGYDLIFLDLKMPGLNGVQTLRRIREFRPAVPVYLITAFYEEFFSELRSVQDEGFSFELLRKPLGSDQIEMVARGLLDGPAII